MKLATPRHDRKRLRSVRRLELGTDRTSPQSIRDRNADRLVRADTDQGRQNHLKATVSDTHRTNYACPYRCPYRFDTHRTNYACPYRCPYRFDTHRTNYACPYRFIVSVHVLIVFIVYKLCMSLSFLIVPCPYRSFLSPIDCRCAFKKRQVATQFHLALTTFPDVGAIRAWFYLSRRKSP